MQELSSSRQYDDSDLRAAVLEAGATAYLTKDKLHPSRTVPVGERLLVRNGQEMAAFRLSFSRR